MFSISKDEETYTGEYETREEAAAAAVEDLGLSPGDAVHVGEAVDLVPDSYLPDADDILDRIAEAVYDQVGEAAEDWPNGVTKEEKAQLTGALKATILAWMDIHCHKPNYFTVENSEAMVVPDPEEKAHG